VEVQWPLGLLLTPHALDRYNLLFQYLLRLKRVAVRLQHAWQVLQKWVAAASCRCDRLPTPPPACCGAWWLLPPPPAAA
jgi:hypothetical protein